MTDTTTTIAVGGDWTDEVFQASAVGPEWNGWLTPRFTHEEADRIVRRPTLDDDSTLTWVTKDDGVAVIRYEVHGDGGFIEFIHADADGLYDLSLGWCWMPVTPDGG